ncbi:hypothetical protein FSP39_022676 [Pinctada imbricata]|uniref:methylcrotonoyl-CoA carboxylase n=1 Tax=Pinctada imbricata TaxID=66713 RepID=A0AA89BQN4_PINIB|nr:hypothetical protein FSP39_022676 [Pinctada imbricata]
MEIVKRLFIQQHAVLRFTQVSVCKSRYSNQLHTSVSKDRKKPFRVLDAGLLKDTEYEKNYLRNVKLTEKCASVEKIAKGGGGEKAILRHTVKQKKLLVQDRLRLLLDDDSDFFELSLTAGLGMEYGDVPRAGMITGVNYYVECLLCWYMIISTGIGKIHGRLCLIVANDATVKGGTVYPITLKKHLRAQEIAEENNLPTVYVVESGGGFLPLQAEIFLPGGRTFYNEAVMSSQGIPQIAIVCGNCTAGGAYIPMMADEAVMIKQQGYIFLGGPPLVQAATGEIISAEELGGAKLHCSVSGCSDYFAEDEEEAFIMGRDIAATLPLHQYCTGPAEEPLYDTQEMLGLISPHNDIDVYKVIARVVDGSRFHEFKTKFGSSLVTGFGYIQNCLVGIVGNNGTITESAADKGAHFVQMSCERDIPIVFLMNTKHCEEQVNHGITGGNMARAHAKMISAVSCSTVPRITIIIGNAIGHQSYLMSGRWTSPNFLFCWPNAVIGMTHPQEAIQGLYQAKSQTVLSDEDREKLHQQITERCTVESSAFYAASRVWNDGIILPQNTRQVIGQCLDIVMAYRRKLETKSAVIRMVQYPVEKILDRVPVYPLSIDDVPSRSYRQTVTMATSPDQVEVRVCPEPVRHRMELRERGHLHNIRVGPYNSHNLLVTHAKFLRSTNDDPGPRVYRLFPFGGTFSLAGDIVGLLTWYLLLVYTVVTIPLACYCDVAQLNITNAVILAILCMYHICAIYFVFRNKAKLKKMWFIAKTTAKNYKGWQNSFLNVTPRDTKELQLLGTNQRQEVVQKMCAKRDRFAMLMLCAASYWRTSVIDPVICLSVLAVLSLTSIIVQIETIKYHTTS